MTTRSPICTVIGHIDHGKTSILDKIRGTAIVKGEAGGITQCISSTKVNLETIKKICGKQLDALKINITLPGILFIDTPGHAAFNNMRKRGGNLADIAILVVNLSEGIKEQTIECIEILKQYKTPFIIAANKVDLIDGWKVTKGDSFSETLKKQNERVKQALDNKVYTLVGKLSEFGLNSERIDRIEDFTKQITIIPCSAATGEGISELLMMLVGLAQKFLEKNLEVGERGRGTVLEVSEEKGVGTMLDVILYDGKLKENDQIVIGGLDKPIVTKIKGLFEPQGKLLKNVKEVSAAAGVRISAMGLKDVVGGVPLLVANENLEEAKAQVQEEVEEVILETDDEGVVIKADTIGSLEALITLLREQNIRIRKAGIGDINKKDIAEAKSAKEQLDRAILGFNVNIAEHSDVKIIVNDVVYRLIEDLSAWRIEEAKKLEAKELEGLVKPAKIQILRGCIFRQSNPAVVGIQILGGTLTNGATLIKLDGSKVDSVKTIQAEKENLAEAGKGKEVAISLPNVTAGRQIHEGDILVTELTEDDFMTFKKLKRYLKGDEVEILKEIAELKRKTDPLWGI
ncbi:MAG: translation initiation factor IF-2 [Candidatus Nanoarchaeia archaeon]|nr:translation initiation factor IF-2 [Candidatus Nanoarchaeia archaeon]